MTALFKNRHARRVDAATRKNGKGADVPVDEDEDDKNDAPQRAEGDTNEDGDSTDSDEGANAADDDDDDPDDDGEPSADDDDDDEEEMRGKGKASQARRRERARCAAIFAAAGPGQVEAAKEIAFGTNVTRQEGIRLLGKLKKDDVAASATVTSTLRASRNPTIGAAGSIKPTSTANATAVWDRAIKKVNPTR